MLAEAQLSFIETALVSSKQQQQPWRLIGNQTLMAHVTVPDIRSQASDLSWVTDNYQKLRYTAMKYIGAFNLPYNLDAWDGYPAAREHFYQRCQQAEVNDLLVLTGDSHCAWFNQLSSADQQAMGYEICTTSVSSPGGDAPFGPNSKPAFDALLTEHNPHILWRNALHRGYTKLEVTPSTTEVSYIGLSTVRSTEFTSFVDKQIKITAADGWLTV